MTFEIASTRTESCLADRQVIRIKVLHIIRGGLLPFRMEDMSENMRMG